MLPSSLARGRAAAAAAVAARTGYGEFAPGPAPSLDVASAFAAAIASASASSSSPSAPPQSYSPYMHVTTYSAVQHQPYLASSPNEFQVVSDEKRNILLPQYGSFFDSQSTSFEVAAGL